MNIALVLITILFPSSEIILAIFRRSKAAAHREDRGSMRLLWIVISIAIVAAVAFQSVHRASILLNPTLRNLLAFWTMVIGLGIRWTAVITLGRFFTVDIAIHDSHKVVSTGLYRYVRHPSYSGLILAFCGLGLSFANWLSLSAIVVPVTLAVLNRIRKEEAALKSALGPSYDSYCARTKRLIPGLL